MKKTSLVNVVLAVIVCSYTGGQVTLDIAQRLGFAEQYWMLSKIVGIIIAGPIFGIIAYWGADIKSFFIGVARTWRETITWRPHWLWWKAFFTRIVAGHVFMTTITLFGFLVIWLISFLVGKPAQIDRVDRVLMLLLFIVYYPLIISFSFPAARAKDYVTDQLISGGDYDKSLERSAKNGWNFAIETNPVSIAISIFRGIWKMSGAAWLNWSRLWSSTKSLISRTFHYVHTDGRRIAFTDTISFIMVGALIGSPAIGAVVGAIVSGIHYFFTRDCRQTVQTHSG